MLLENQKKYDFMFNDFIISQDRKKVLFSPMGSSLGDNINFASLLTGYKYFNPNHQIEVQAPEQRERDIILDEYDVWYWADATNFLPKPILSERVAEYDLMTVVGRLADIGIYPAYYSTGDNKVQKEPPLICLYSRNIKKAKRKNVKKDIFTMILNLLAVRFDKHKIMLIGNDYQYNTKEENGYYENVIDVRMRLTIDQIFKLLNKSEYYVGSDGGITHLAGCSHKTKMYCYGFSDVKWFPKTQNRCQCIIGRERDDVFKLLENMGVFE